MLVFMKIAKNTEGSKSSASPAGGPSKKKANQPGPLPQGNVASQGSASPAGGLQRKNKKGCALFITHLVPANKFAASGE